MTQILKPDLASFFAVAKPKPDEPPKIIAQCFCIVCVCVFKCLCVQVSATLTHKHLNTF